MKNVDAGATAKKSRCRPTIQGPASHCVKLCTEAQVVVNIQLLTYAVSFVFSYCHFLRRRRVSISTQSEVLFCNKTLYLLDVSPHYPD